MTETILQDIMRVLDILVLERADESSFRLVVPPPQWYRTLCGGCDEAPGAIVKPQEKLAFIANFLEDAERVWRANDPPVLPSGMWEETDPSGFDLTLEATALNAGARKILLVTQAGEDYSRMQSLSQRMRDVSLLYESLLKEIQKKEILINFIVHDLMGPLTSITAALDLLSDGDLDEAAKLDILESGKKGAQDQRAMILEILDAFSGEAGATDVSQLTKKNAPDAEMCAREVFESFRPAFTQRKVRLRFVAEGAAGQSGKVIAGKPHLVRVLANLVENALRHSPPETTVTIGLRNADNGVTFFVDDEGPGVPKSLSGSLFRSFVRGGEKTGKAGLGLYFCRITVERWGGVIGVKSLPEKGSRFWFRLRKPPDGTDG